MSIPHRPGPLDALLVAIVGVTLALAVLAGFGLLVGVLPAWRGLRTPVSANLHPTD